MKNFTFLVVSLLFATSLSAQKYVNEFLNIGISARALGMSNSVIASVDDVSGGYWNPSALATVQEPFQVGAMHAEWFAGIAKFDYLSAGSQLGKDKNAFGAISLIRFGIDNIPNTLNLIGPEGQIQYDQVTEFSSADYAFLVSYGKKIGNSGNWFAGGTAKIIHRTIGPFGKSYGFGGDLGITYRGDKWNLALVGRDITTTFNSWSFTLDESQKEIFTLTGNEIPVSSSETTNPRIILGAARKMKIGSNYGLLLETNLNFTTDGKRNTLVSADPVSMDPHLGAELDFKNIVFLRGGIGNFQKVKELATDESIWQYQPTFGVGFKLGDQFGIDYALTNIGNVSDVSYSHVISLFVNFNKKQKDQAGREVEIR